MIGKAYSRWAKRELGFTLLELLVSIVILSLIITISYSAFQVGSRSWQASAKFISENSTIRFAEDFIRKKIEQLYPIYWNDGVQKRIAFLGEEDGVKFIAPAPQGREVEEYYEYYIVKQYIEHNELSLFLYFEPHDPSAQAFKVSKESPYRQIMSKLNSVEFFYYGSQGNNKEDDWNQVWEDTTPEFPSIVKISATSEDKREYWLDVTVEPRSEINSQYGSK